MTDARRKLLAMENAFNRKQANLAKIPPFPFRKTPLTPPLADPSPFVFPEMSELELMRERLFAGPDPLDEDDDEDDGLLLKGSLERKP